MNAADVIRKKRDAKELDDAEIRSFVSAFLDGEVAPYQMSALLMAITIQGMSARETASLTRVMVETGDRLTFPEVTGIPVDKHSTGGIGDLVSLPLAPLVAACGVPVPMISGRGLGHTGGTLDKLESIPGLRTDLDPSRFRAVLSEVGFVMGGQTANLAPADRLMYALRDVTGTVESIPLIVSSILSKKIAEGAAALVLDVKCGRGAFMKSEAEALALAGELVRVAGEMELRAVAFVTDMDAPLGNAAGNAIEVETAIACLRGQGPEDLMELVRTLGAAMLLLGDRAATWEEAEAAIAGKIHDGSGLLRFRAMIRAQGGDDSVIDDPARLPQAAHVVPVPAKERGFVTDIDPLAVGRAVLDLGGGRRRAEDRIDPSVGVRLVKRLGDRVDKGETLALVLGPDPAVAERVASERVAAAFALGASPVAPRVLVKRLVTPAGTTAWTGPRTWTEGMGRSR